LEAKIAELRKEFEIEDEEAVESGIQEASREKIIDGNREAMARSRRADTGDGGARSRKRN
jgi:hypothetical protein